MLKINEETDRYYYRLEPIDESLLGSLSFENYVENNYSNQIENDFLKVKNKTERVFYYEHCYQLVQRALIF